MIKSKLAEQPQKKGYADKFYTHFFPAPQTGFVIGSIADIRNVFNNVQIATLYELHHEMLTRPMQPGNMPNINGPYECNLDVFDDKIMKSHLLSRKRNYYDKAKQNSNEYAVQFFVKKTPDMEMERRIKLWCKEQGIELRYLDSSFFVGAVQIWLADKSNTKGNKKKLVKEVSKIIKDVMALKTPSGAPVWGPNPQVPYEDNRIVFYDDVMVTEFCPIVELSKEVKPTEDYYEFVEKVLKSES